MVIVTGSARAHAHNIERMLELSLEHVRRSRDEPGCLLHTFHRDAEDPHRLVFLEHWKDEEALRKHFAMPASGQFLDEVTALAEAAPEISIFDAHPISM